jgi:hypothetical protein
VDQIPNRVRVVPLGGSRRAFALISEIDAERVLAHAWTLNSNGYAWRTIHRPRHVYLHRFLMDCEPGDGLYVDHINRDRLDNRRENLRIVTPAESRQNTPAIGGVSSARGVVFDRARGLWIASVQLDGKHHHIGRYRTEAEAADAARQWRLAHMPFTVEDIA